MSYACKVYEGLSGLDLLDITQRGKKIEEKAVCIITRTILLQSELGFQHEKRLLFVNRTFLNVPVLISNLIKGNSSEVWNPVAQTSYVSETGFNINHKLLIAVTC